MFKIFLLLLSGLLFAIPVRAQTKFIDEKPFIHWPRAGVPPGQANHPAYRTYDGTNNNIISSRKEWGATDIALFREMPAAYSLPDSKNTMNGTNRPSAREISNVVCDEPIVHFSARELSTFCYVWGQFLDHDITLTPVANTEYYPVLLPANETVFTVEIPFMRSDVKPGTGVTNNREQININTAWIDGSQVYGSDSIRAHWLRSHVNGKMKVSAGNMLPYNTNTGELSGTLDVNAPSMASDNNHTTKSFVAGDVRAVEHPGILCLHTIFVREHNRICDRLISEGLTNDETIYQKARKEVGAMMQVITYQEFLPAIGVALSPYTSYNSAVRPDINNTFATAAYRIGHTMVADEILMRDDDCEDVAPGEVDLLDAFFNQQLVVDNGVDVFIKGFAAHTQYETDTRVNSILRNFLFGSPTAAVRSGLDLACLNIQRGRDHGLPSYKAVRTFYTGVTINSFSQITTDASLAAQLQSLYGTVDNIDLWVGLLSEDRVAGKSVGTTMHAMLKSQFEKLRDGDYYFYKYDPNLPSNIRSEIRHTTFADILQRNSGLTTLQDNVFFAETCPGDTLEEGEERISQQPLDGYIYTDVSIHPNPASNELFVDLNNIEEPVIVKVFGADGTLVRDMKTQGTEKSIRLNTEKIPNGIYMVHVIYGDNVETIRFVKME